MKQTKHSTKLYEQVYSMLRRQIFAGELQPGDLLPSESQLCKEFNASRETIRKGLKELENESLVFSKPKIGYFVSSPNHGEISINVGDSVIGLPNKYKDVNGIRPDERLQKILGIDANQRVIELAKITYSEDQRPIAYEINYVPYQKANPTVESAMRYAVLPELTLSKVATYDFYTEVKISAVFADEKISEALQCSTSEPLLLVEQIFKRQDGNVVGYLKQYSKAPYNNLYGTSGHRE